MSISRDTVGSEATGPNTCGCAARIWATSARQSPPMANDIARFSPAPHSQEHVVAQRHGRGTPAASAAHGTAQLHP